MAEEFFCWHCHQSLGKVMLPMSRRESCAHCGADQHVCKLCLHFDHRGRCTEPRADDERDTDKANFCDYFAPASGIRGKATFKQDKVAKARADLAALFGDEAPANDNGGAEKKEPNDKGQGPALTPAQIAEQKLRDMLGD